MRDFEYLKTILTDSDITSVKRDLDTIELTGTHKEVLGCKIYVKLYINANVHAILEGYKPNVKFDIKVNNRTMVGNLVIPETDYKKVMSILNGIEESVSKKEREETAKFFSSLFK